MPRRIYTYNAGLDWDLWNMVATIGSFSIALSILVFLIAVAVSFRRGVRAGNDPWDGATLEWTIPSPPPHYNFATLPVVHSARPYWDEKYGFGHGEHGLPPEPHPAAAGAHHPAPADHHAEHSGHDDQDEHGHAHVAMPDPSYWPAVAALGLSIVFGGLLVGIWLSILGLALMVVSIYAWSLEPTMESA
jgi:hypothetical protein